MSEFANEGEFLAHLEALDAEALVEEESLGRAAFDAWRRDQRWQVTYDWADMSHNEKRAWVERAKRERDGTP